ncbi:MAG TPA: Ig-like domain-containing protein [Actinomycetota bacterium]|nr:Ig-like domain-containing protein [Actinomycetota bacterium]
MRKILVLFVASLLVATSIGGVGARRQGPPPHRLSPPGQISVVAVNAKQQRVLGLKRFLAMFELGRALRFRPPAFDGGSTGAVMPPDVVIIEEMRPSNLEIFERLLRQRYPDYKYKIAGEPELAASIIFNSNTLQLESFEQWGDVCTTAETPTDGRANRDYPIARLVDVNTSALVTVAGIHFAKNYRTSNKRNCVEQNITELRTQLADEMGAVIIGGDFNRRATTELRECDRNEESAPNDWWLLLTDPSDGGRAYSDAVRSWHRSHGMFMTREWTHEQKRTTMVCDASERKRRTRIDYLFTSGALVAEAHADHPGWAGPHAGTLHPRNYRYSDHRFVWGRFVITPTPQALKPEIESRAQGEIALAWEPIPGAQGWILYRARQGEPYRELAHLPAETVGYTDIETAHATHYRYAIAAVGSDGGQGLESFAARAEADARGPTPVHLTPDRGAVGVGRGIRIVIRFDEAIDPASIDPTRVHLSLGTPHVRGTLRLFTPRVLTFTPSRPLRSGATYRFYAAGLRDKLGNRGRYFSFPFTVEGRLRP